MSSEKLIKSKSAINYFNFSLSLIVIISLGIRQTFGMFYFDFSVGFRNYPLRQFSFAIGLANVFMGSYLVHGLELLPINMEVILLYL